MEAVARLLKKSVNAFVIRPPDAKTLVRCIFSS